MNRSDSGCMVLAEDHEKELVRHYLGSEVGTFVEVGANHPRDGSQTYHLAQKGWRGILVEPQRRLFEMLKQERPEAYVVRAACTGPESVGTITLHIPAENGFATVEPNKDDFYVKYERTEEVEAKTLDQIIDEWKEGKSAAMRIRFLAIDVEGHEADVLRGFSLSRHRPDLVLIEDKLQDLSKHRLLTAQGYRLVRRTALNNWYIPKHSAPPDVSALERVKLYRKVFLGLPFRMLRRWRHRRRKG